MPVDLMRSFGVPQHYRDWVCRLLNGGREECNC
jgi:hypothetical protein